MQSSEFTAVAAPSQRSLLRILLMLVALAPAWRSSEPGGFHAVKEGEAETLTQLANSTVLPYPSAPMEFVATAYCEQGITKSGVPTETGLVAADPLILPLGSWIHIENSVQRGIYQVMDTGRFIKGKRIDIFLPSLKEAAEFGRQKIQVTVLKYAPSRPELVESGEGLMARSEAGYLSTDDLPGAPGPGRNLLKVLKSLAIWDNSSVREVSSR